MVTVIIRSVGERTESICREIISKQIPEKNIFIVGEIPFSATLKKSFDLGIAEDRKWTLCIDSDVLLADGTIDKMLKIAEMQPENICEVQFHIFDKFFNMRRQAGNHLYRTSLLHEVIRRIPEEGINIRPEFHTLTIMKEAGFPYISFDETIGCHDYEQFNSDIFRKMYVHAHKHTEYIPTLVSLWRERCANDFDFQVALWGLAAGIAFNQAVYINKNTAPYEFINYFSNSNYKEKEVIANNNEIIKHINDLVNLSNIEFRKSKQVIVLKDLPDENVNKNSKYSFTSIYNKFLKK